MEIVITGRRTDVPERFRRQVEEKLSKVSQFAPRAHRIDVEWSRERNPRQAAHCERVEITVRDKGPVVRAEASAEDFLGALDLATGKLVERLRRLGDRKKVHHGRHAPASVRSGATGVGVSPRAAADILDDVAEPAARPDLPEGAEELADSPVMIRTKDHFAEPMTVEQALYEMELVGHDFFLYVDAACGKPCVVYRRQGWNYGVIKLHAGDVAEAAAAEALAHADGSTDGSTYGSSDGSTDGHVNGQLNGRTSAQLNGHATRSPEVAQGV